MHCDKVIRELAVPTDDRDSAVLAEHLANCPSCAGWAKKDAQFDRLWDATRPVEPSAAGLGYRMGSHCFIARFLDVGRV